MEQDFINKQLFNTNRNFIELSFNDAEIGKGVEFVVTSRFYIFNIFTYKY